MSARTGCTSQTTTTSAPGAGLDARRTLTNPSKAKGTSWESAIVAHLQGSGFPYAERRALAGTQDRGDIAGIPGVMLEAKNCKQLSLSQWMDEVRVQKKNAGAQVGAAVVKRRNHQTGRAYVVMEFDDFLDLIR